MKTGAENEHRSSRPWTHIINPESFLVIRFHAIGDVAITLPFCASLRARFPSARIDYLTSPPCVDLLQAVTTFDKIYSHPISNRALKRLTNALSWGFDLKSQHYDVIVDLQRNLQSRVIRIASKPTSWSEFDRYSPQTAGERVHNTFQEAGFKDLSPTYRLPVHENILDEARKKLRMNGWQDHKLIVFNPAGLWKTRNWPLENYVLLAKRILSLGSFQILLLGTERIRDRAHFLWKQIGSNVINLVDQTTLGEALSVLQLVTAVVSEDSGLMHMAWVSGIPTIALFGSTRHDWASPLGQHTITLHSGDLSCGACNLPECRFGDVHCLTRFSPEEVFTLLMKLMDSPCPQPLVKQKELPF